MNINIKVEMLEDGLLGFGIVGMYVFGIGNLEMIDVIYVGYFGIWEVVVFVVEELIFGVWIYVVLVLEVGNVFDVGMFFVYLDVEGVDFVKIFYRVLIL